MTIICAIHEPGVGTWIGSDTMGERDGRRVNNGSKWTILGSRAIAAAGLALTNNIITYNAEVLLSGAMFGLLKMLIFPCSKVRFSD
jgi:hypothetical protein